MLCLRWTQLGVKLSQKGAKVRNVAHARMSMCTFLLLFPTFFGSDWGSCKGACLRPTSTAARCPTQDHVAHGKRNLHPNMWTPVGLKLGASWGQLAGSGASTPKLGPSRLLFSLTQGQGRPSLAPVGCQVSPLLSSLSFSLGAGGFSSQSDSNMYLEYV